MMNEPPRAAETWFAMNLQSKTVERTVEWIGAKNFLDSLMARLKVGEWVIWMASSLSSVA